jgi:AraC-like DNA-binding protein
MSRSEPIRYRSRLGTWRGEPAIMPAAHRHDDLEVNVTVLGDMVYVLGGQVVRIPAGTTAVFWAAIPHQLVDRTLGAVAHWLTVPLDVVLRFGLPEGALGGFLRGEPATLHAVDPEGLPPTWDTDLAGPEPELRAAALLEVEAWLRRRLFAIGRDGSVVQGGGTPLPREVQLATAMARDVAVHFREPLTVARVAAAAHLSPGHAMTVFRRVVGTTVAAYLTQCRVAEAQRLLLTTSATTTQVGTQAGFTSQSAFYAAFRATCGEAPGAYRTRVLRENGGSERG